jgi:two-component system sensor histidine kinase LytS
MTIQLSQLYRHVLEACRNDAHSLEHEINLCRLYLEIEKARFGERVRFEFEVDPGIFPSEIEVPALTLQPLIENAIKHGIAPRSSGGFVRIRVVRAGSRIELSVEDDGVGIGRSSATNGSGSGIQNCRMRLQLKYGDSAGLTIEPVSPSGTRAEVFLPLRGRISE